MTITAENIKSTLVDMPPGSFLGASSDDIATFLSWLLKGDADAAQLRNVEFYSGAGRLLAESVGSISPVDLREAKVVEPIILAWQIASQPFAADAAVEVAVPVETGLRDAANAPVAGRIGRQHWWRQHLERSHDRGDLTERDIEITVRNGHPYSPSSLANTPFTARAQPASLRWRVAALIAGLKRCSSRQLSANFSGSG